MSAPQAKAPGPLARFLNIKARALAGRARRLATLERRAVGLRAEDMPYAPLQAHFDSANRRLKQIDGAVRARLSELARPTAAQSLEDRLLAMAMVERELDRARRAFGLFFEVFAQRGTAFAPALAAHDAIARDCYAAVRNGARLFKKRLIPPLTYLEHGYSPATMRRGVALGRLFGESNPFPLIKIPFDRDHPWESVFLHEVAHNLQADLGLWVELKQSVIQRLAEMRLTPRVVAIFGRWHKEIFADLAAMLLGGPAVAWGMAEFLAHPADKVMNYRPGGPHPTGYLRVLILSEMLRRMGFEEYAANLLNIWTTVYRPSRGHRIPRILLTEASRAIPAVVDEIAYQPRRALAEQALAGVITFSRSDQSAIRRSGMLLAAGKPPGEIPPRFLVGAARYAIESGADVRDLNRLMIARLVRADVPAGPFTTRQAA